MKVEVVNPDDFDNVNYPCLYKSTTDELVVLFMDDTKGVVLVGNKIYSVGHYDGGWVECYDTTTWFKFNGKITLENDK